MREGFLFIWRNEGLRNQTVVYTVSNLLFPMVMLALPFLVEDVMKLKGSWYGYLMSTLTLGSIAGYLVFGSLRTTDRQNYLVICAIFFVEALLFLLVSLVTNVFLVFLLFSLLAGSMAISRLINTSLKQKAIPEKLRGRVFGTLDSVNGALAPLSFAFGGIIIDALDKKVSVLFFLIFAVHVMLAVAFVVNGPIRRFYLNSGDLVGVDHGDD
jgi:MFS family permease